MSSPAPVQPSRVVVGGMAADLYGHPTDPAGRDEPAPLVLLHGLAFSRRTWQPVLDRLTDLDADRRILVLDLPGAGESPAQLPHTFAHLVDLVHAAVEEVAFQAPVVVGHSHGGGLAATYAARHPCRGAVSVDSAPADVPAFVGMLKQYEPMLRGTGFPRVWDRLEASFQLHLLPPAMRRLVEATCTPTQDLVLSYWSELLEASEADIAAMLADTTAALHFRGIPAVLVLGNPRSPALRELLAGQSPETAAARIEDWSPSGHFPHLAHVDRFAELLAGTATWTAAPLPAATDAGLAAAGS